MIRESTDLQAVVEHQKLYSIPKCNCNYIYKVDNEKEGVGNWIIIAVLVMIEVITPINH